MYHKWVLLPCIKKNTFLLNGSWKNMPGLRRDVPPTLHYTHGPVNRKTQITTEIWKCQEIQHFDRKIPQGTTCEVMSYLRVKN